MNNTTKTKTDKLLHALYAANGNNVLISKLRKHTGLVNVSSAVDRLRNEGFEIFWNTRKVNGRTVNYYRLRA